MTLNPDSSATAVSSIPDIKKGPLRKFIDEATTDMIGLTGSPDPQISKTAAQTLKEASEKILEENQQPK